MKNTLNVRKKFKIELDQKSIAIFLHLQGKNKKTIFTEMKLALQDKCISYSTITKYIRSYKTFKTVEYEESTPNFHDLKIVNEKILNVLDEEPFASVRYIARTTGIPKSTVFYHLTNLLSFKSMNLRWVPHNLTEQQKIQRVTISKALIKILRSAKHHSYIYFVTGDESWFEYSYYPARQWVPIGNKPQTRPNRVLTDKKIMLTVFWNPDGIKLINFLPKGETFNSEYYVQNIICELAKINSGYPDIDGRRLTVHADNARPHISKSATNAMTNNGLKRAPHPPYSPDISPSDFFLFGYIKNKMEGHSFESREEVERYITEILQQIPNDMLKRVFSEWERRLEQLIHTNVEYIQ